MEHDFIKEFIDLGYAQSLKTNKRFQMNVDSIGNVAVVELIIGVKRQTKWFVDGMPNQSYWLTREERLPYVIKMFKAGMTRTRIAQFLGFSSTTVGKDIKYVLDVSPWLLEGRITKDKIRDTVIIADYRNPKGITPKVHIDATDAFVAAHTTH